MEPITDCFEKLKEEFSVCEITYKYSRTDPNDPDNLLLEYLVDDLEAYYSGKSFFYLNGESFNSSYFNDLFIESIKEFETNLYMPISLATLTEYYNLVLYFASTFELSIIKNKGLWILSNATFDGINYEDLSTELKEELSKNFVEMKYSIREFIDGLIKRFSNFIHKVDPLPENIKPENLSIAHEQANTKKIIKSFEFVFPALIEKQYFKDFVSTLVEYNYIGESEKNKTKRVFSGVQNVDPIIWIGTKGALKYLIKQLKSNGIIKGPKAFWETTSNCFKFKDEEISPGNIRSQNYPTKDSTKSQLNSLISFLKKGHNEIKLGRLERIRKI